MKESVLSLKEKQHSIGFSYFQIGCMYIKSFKTDWLNIILMNLVYNN